MKKALAIVLSVIMVLSMGITSFAAETDYIIVSPYADVDWDTFSAYKTDLHSHTIASDGDDTTKEMAERHYELGFDIYAQSDHGTVNYSWTEKDSYDPAIKFIMMFKEGIAPLEMLEKEGTAENGKAYTVTTVDGDDYYAQEGGHTMMRVPLANEQNPTSFNNAHVNTFFADWGHGRIGGTSDYATPISAVHELGGVSVINHPGEYTNARDVLTTEEAYNDDDFGYYIDKFENLLMTYDSCIGIDINSKGDSRTRFDRKLWDTMLTDLVPAGRNVFAIASTDAHNLGIVDSGYVMAMMPELTSAALKDCLLAGAFFAQSCYCGNTDELVAYSEALLASDNAQAVALGEKMKETADNNIAEIANGDKGGQYRFAEDGAVTEVTSIAVDDEEDTITIDAENALYIRWISDNGTVVAEGNSIDLDECENIGSYVRAEILSEGAVTYTQAFTLYYEGMPEADYNENFKDTDTFLFAGIDEFLRGLAKAVSAFAEPVLKLFGVV